MRVVKIPAQKSAEMLQYFRNIDAVFQGERAGIAFNKYDVKSYVVRSRSEALACKKLKSAARYIFQENFVEADRLITEAKISIPDYFEIHKMEAFLHVQNGDYPSACESYEQALELDDSQPQLHYFLAGLLSRYMSDFDGANSHLARALELDPDATILLREAARVACFMYDFPLARQHLEAAAKVGHKTVRDEIIFADLRSQFFYRQSDYLASQGDVTGALASLGELADWIESLPSHTFDETHKTHLVKAHRPIQTLRRSGNADELTLRRVESLITAKVASC